MRTSIRWAPALAALLVATACADASRNDRTEAQQTPVDDARIVTAIQAKYYASPAVRGRDVNVDSENGVVTLRGTVDTEGARQEAVAIARSTDEVVRVDDQLTLATDAERTMARSAQPEASSPAWITTKIQAQYYQHPGLKPWNIDVETRSGGVVTLSGIVDNADDHAEAVKIARTTEGVTAVTDRLRVKGEAAATTGTAERAGEAITDAWITTKIQARYFADDEVKGRNIDVDTNDGVVTLKGTVNSYSERLQAAAIARNTEGVRVVHDELSIEAAGADRARERGAAESVGTAGQTVEDAWITTKIQAKFFVDDQIKGRDVNVDTKNGVVTLKGAVQTEAAKKAAEALASETGGVRRVVNQLRIDKSA